VILGGVFLLACAGGAQAPKAFSVPVVVAPVERGPFRAVASLTGELQSPREGVLAAEISGTVAEAPRRLGDRVEAGDLVVRLDARSQQIALRQAEAARERAGADVAVREAALGREKFQTQRVLSVAAHDPGAVSEGEAEAARLGLQEAEAQVAAARGELAARDAAVDAARLDLARTRLEAPFAGVVSRQDARTGQRVGAGTVLAGVLGIGALEAVLDAGEAWAGRITPGVATEVRNSAGETAVGVVAGVVPAAQGGARNQRVRVDITEPPSGFIPGLPVTATVVVSTLADALLVPRDAVAQGTVFVVAEGKARRVPVQQAGDGGVIVAVEGALSAGELVVVRGNEALQDGSPVTVVGGS
jgi:cobalt-zinc-cadmium efflux system membrane fusion protein